MKKVMLVEDELNLLNLYKKTLLLHGYEVETAQDGEEALSKIKGFKPDIIFLDYILPTINGGEVLAKIRAIPELRAVPVIILTGTTDKMEETFTKGATAYLHKGTNTTKKILDCIKIYSR